MNILVKGANSYNLISNDSYLLDKRKLFLEGEINNESALEFSKNLMILAEENLPIQIFINSPGGSIEAGLTILDMINSFPQEIETYCLGKAYSMAAIIFILSKNRYIFPSSKLMLHEPLVSQITRSSTSEIKEISSMLDTHKKKIIKLLAERTGQTSKFFEKELSKDTFYNSDECLKYNYADKIITLKDIKEVDLWNSTT